MKLQLKRRMLCKLKYIDVKESITLMMMKQTRRVAELSPIGQAEVRGQQRRGSMVGSPDRAVNGTSRSFTMFLKGPTVITLSTHHVKLLV